VDLLRNSVIQDDETDKCSKNKYQRASGDLAQAADMYSEKILIKHKMKH
jgi:hypothetical protein